ncbi:MAG: hypothetical protein EP343_00125 [Deltaproteobacteria bacterium]|nr:MAG: hypothetical protein EP343_00125 [Deltaproteobacteria bacterium]
MVGELSPQETHMLVDVHQDFDGHTDNLAVSFEILSGEVEALLEARESQSVRDYFQALVKRAQQKRRKEDQAKSGRAPLDMDESRMFCDARYKERKHGAPPPASDRFVLSNILGWNVEEKYACLDGGYRDIAEKLWQQVEATFSPKKKIYVECFRLHTGNPSYWDYNELSEEFGIEPGTIRAGVHRVKKELIKLIHQIENHTFAPPHRDIPKDVLEARRLLEIGEFEEAQHKLNSMKETYQENPFFYKAQGDLASEQKLDHKAIGWYQKALAYADNPVLRSRICNNWAFTEDSLGNKKGAQRLWLRALRLDPDNYVPRFNLFCEDSLAQNMTGCKHHLDEFGKLLAAGKLSEEDQADFLASLRTEKELEWVRSIRSFRRTMGSWQTRYGSQAETSAACYPIAVLVALALASLLLVATLGNSNSSASYSNMPQQTLSKKKQKKGKKKRPVFAKKKQKKGKKKQRSFHA